MKKKLLFYCIVMGAIFLSVRLFAQLPPPPTGPPPPPYFFEHFEDGTLFPGSGNTNKPTEVVTLDGTWVLYYSYRTTSSSGTPVGTADIRMIKTSLVTDPNDGLYCYIITPIVKKGISTISFYEGWGGRHITIEKSTDGGKNWTMVGIDTTIAKMYNYFDINDPKTDRIRLSNRGSSDADIDEFMVIPYPETGVADRIAFSERFILHQNFPNPFNPSTTIRYDLVEAAHVILTVYDALGQKKALLVNSRQTSGIHEIIWNGCADDGTVLPNGAYFYRIDAPGYNKTMKMILLK